LEIWRTTKEETSQNYDSEYAQKAAFPMVSRYHEARKNMVTGFLAGRFFRLAVLVRH